MAFALKKAIATATSSNLCQKFFRLPPESLSTPPISLFTGTRFSFLSTTTSSGSESQVKDKNGDGSSSIRDPPLIVKGSPQELKMENPFQLRGPEDVITVDELKDGNGVLVRVTLPGVGEDGFKVWAEKNTVFFTGRGDIEREDEECGRHYGGSLEFNPEFNKVDEVQAEMKNGILRMIIPNVANLENK